MKSQNNHNDLVPSVFYLGQNYPNPFKEITKIKYCVAYKTKVKLTVYDSEYNIVEQLVNEEQNPGTYEVTFNASADHTGKTRIIADGYYFYRMVAGDYNSDKKWLCKNSLLGWLTMNSLRKTLL